jgi:hypothetical protein
MFKQLRTLIFITGTLALTACGGGDPVETSTEKMQAPPEAFAESLAFHQWSSVRLGSKWRRLFGK